ncbi:2S sulfur-rich seed storage protein 2 [Gossypium raimondii]|uniref:2S sulfur-rich seed storage protein 2 n=1 Tax=Gossypium raimondii TaxID=29730 RepID=UPI00063AE2FA|nr:2S sulfur-rich seed storage protein 2 [Gossypium raimondii]
MAKLALLVATFALAFFLVNASIYRTTITLDSYEENRFDAWYMQQETGGISTYNTQLLNSCCDQLQNLDEGSRSTGLKQAVREQLQEGQWESEEAKDMFEVAERELRKCDLEPRRCDMQSRRWF